MIGNDVIDLKLALKQSNYQRKGLIEKLFHTSEQQLILNADEPDVCFWNLWSRKEAAYKIFNRVTKIRAFNPKQFYCEPPFLLDGVLFGKVVSINQSYWVRTKVDSLLVYSEAVLNREDFNRIREISSVDVDKDSHGIPHHKITGNPVSVTHHGAYEKRIQLDGQIEPRL